MRRHEYIGHQDVVAAGPAHTQGAPCIDNHPLVCRTHRHQRHRRPIRGEPRRIAVMDLCQTHEPSCLMCAAGEWRLPRDTIAAIDRDRTARRKEPRGKGCIRLTKDLPRPVIREPCTECVNGGRKL